MDPSGSGALIALRSAAEGLRALGDTPQHRPQSPPQPPRGLWSGSDLFAFRPDVGSLRRSVPPTPGIPRGGACRAVGWGVGGLCVGLWRCSAPPAQPPPLPLCHTRSEEGAARSARTDAGPGKGPGSPIGPTVCVWGRAVWGGWSGGGVGGRHLGVTAAAGTGRACSGPAADVSSADKQPESGGDKRLLCSRPSGRTSSAGAEPPPPFIPPLPFLPPALSVGWAADCRPGGVGSGCGMRDAGCGRRGAAHRAAEQSQRRADAPPSLQVPPPRLPPPRLGAAGSPPVAPMPSIPAALPSPLPTRPPLLARSLVPPPTALSCSRRSPRTPPTPPSGAAPAWLRPGCAHAVPRGGQC